MWRKTVQFYWLKSVYFILPFTRVDQLYAPNILLTVLYPDFLKKAKKTMLEAVAEISGFQFYYSD